MFRLSSTRGPTTTRRCQCDVWLVKLLLTARVEGRKPHISFIYFPFLIYVPRCSAVYAAQG